MRGIKFRVWDKEGLVMVPWEELLEDYNLNRMPWLVGDGFHVFMQYTGLKDKNGKEIYEGDVIAMSGGYIKRDKNKHEKPHCIVTGFVPHDVWNDKFLLSGLMLEGISPNCAEIIFLEEWASIIGNIYENPELLGKNKI